MLLTMQEGAGPRPFDVTTRRLIEADPEGWLAWIGLPADGPVRAIESDVSTVLAQVDKVLRVDGPRPWIAHVEVQSGHDSHLPLRLLEYHVLLLRRHDVRVATSVVLLRPDAHDPELTGRFEVYDPTDDLTITFKYRVIRLWERPVDELLRGGIGVLPLAPLVVEPAQVPGVIAQLDARFAREASVVSASELWSATLLLLGLRYDADEARHLLRGVTGMRESSTYQAILEEGREEGREQGREQGRVEGARRLLLRFGTRKFGAPDAGAEAALARIDDLDVLERLSDDLLTATSWADLLRSAP
jgi:predicted transposase YdaD